MNNSSDEKTGETMSPSGSAKRLEEVLDNLDLETLSSPLLRTLLSQTMETLKVARRRVDEQESKIEILTRLSTTDPATSLLNMRGIHLTLRKLLARAKRDETGGALLVIDLDGFKAINDSYGHLIGDKVIQGIAAIMSSSLHRSGFDPNAVLEQLYRLTPLEDSFGINNVALVEGQPQTLGLKEMLEVYVGHRIEVVTRRSRHRLGKRRAGLRDEAILVQRAAQHELGELVEAQRGEWADDQLFEHADPFGPIASRNQDGNLDMQVFRRQRVAIRQHDVFAFDPERAVVHAVAPLGAGVAQPAHLEPAQRFESNLFGRTA